MAQRSGKKECQQAAENDMERGRKWKRERLAVNRIPFYYDRMISESALPFASSSTSLSR